MSPGGGTGAYEALFAHFAARMARGALLLWATAADGSLGRGRPARRTATGAAGRDG